MKEIELKCGYNWMYEKDPFDAYKKFEEKRTSKQGSSPNSVNDTCNNKIAICSVESGLQPSSSRAGAGWTGAPKIDMGKDMRRKVESLVRSKSIWSRDGSRLSWNDRLAVIKKLVSLGFRRSHVEEATEYCTDLTNMIEWLNMFVPEDDLPRWCLPQAYEVGVSVASDDLKRESAINRLASRGYTVEDCAKSFDEFERDEIRSAMHLQNKLINGASTASENTTYTVKVDESLDSDVWEEEMNIMSSIYGSQCHRLSRVKTQLVLRNLPIHADHVSVQFERPIGPYPQVLPLLCFNAPLPTYIRLSITKQMLLHARNNLIGQHMIFGMVDWLQHEFPRLVEHPGKLSDLYLHISANATNQVLFRNKQPSTDPSMRIDSLEGKSIPNGVRSMKKPFKVVDANEKAKFMKLRKSLPAWQMRHEIIETVDDHQVVLISGETGSGKSTQSVQFILDEMISRGYVKSTNIICTQPRRISAVALAQRVAEERLSAIGDEIGYAIRGERKFSHGITKITYMTTGVLLRRLQSARKQGNSLSGVFGGISHLFVDEVHARGVEADFILLMLKDILQSSNVPKVILMSATSDLAAFEEYFSTVCSVGKVVVEGRTYPVEDIYLEDILQKTSYGGAYNNEWKSQEIVKSVEHHIGRTIGLAGSQINYDQIRRTVQLIDLELRNTDGSILIFLPGIVEIEKTIQVYIMTVTYIKFAKTIKTLSVIREVYSFPLHSSLPLSDQNNVFKKAPMGKRKVIAATNIAETAITIDDVVAVIDTGRVKEMSFDSRTTTAMLTQVWASRASGKQRKGRAGRVKAGKCYKLYTRELEAKTMPERSEPEILRLPLDQLCLSVMMMGIQDVKSFFKKALSHPDVSSIEDAMNVLHKIGALEDGRLTGLGRHIASVPADLRCSKLLIYGSMFGCLEASLVISAILTAKSPFFTTGNQREEAKMARASFARGKGDLICDLRAFQEWQKKTENLSSSLVKSWCRENCLSPFNLDDIASNRAYFLSIMIEAQWVPSNYVFDQPKNYSANKYGDNDMLLQAIIAAALSPQIASINLPDKKFALLHSGSLEVNPEARTIKYFDRFRDRVFIHPSSTLFEAQGYGNASFLSFWSKTMSSKNYIREITSLNAYSLLLFCGSINYDDAGRGIVIDGYWKLQGWAKIGVLVSKLRTLLDELLSQKIDDPRLDICQNEIVDLARKLIELNGQDR